MILNLSDLSEEPLHAQISRQIREEILAGTLSPGTSLTSIRVLARTNKVSVITVQRAYEDLERESLIVPRRGKGFFVNGISADERRAMARARFLDTLRPVLRQARQEGLEEREIVALIRREIGDP